jgi:hypothetical protein
MLTNLIRAGRWSDLPSERWVRPVFRLWSATCLICVIGGIALTDMGTFWDFFYAFFC